MSWRWRPKPCNGCGAPKPPGRARKLCDPCAAKGQEARAQRGRGVRGLMLKPRYGITIDEYDALLLSQGEVCAICQKLPQTSRILKLAVDHDHATGEIRGLLCQRCNMGLHFLENLAWRGRAEMYLAAPPAGRCMPLLAEPAAVAGTPAEVAV